MEHVGYSYLRHCVEILQDGQTAAVLLDPEATRCALAVAERFRERRPPITQDAINKRLDAPVTQFIQDDPIALYARARSRDT